MRYHLFFLMTITMGLRSLTGHAAVEVVVESKIFHIPGQGPRVEVNMAVMAGTMTSRMSSLGSWQTRVEALTIVMQEGAIKTFSKVEVTGLERMDTLQVDLLHQEFFDLSAGQYELIVEVRDLNSDDTTATRYKGPLAVGTLQPGLSISEVLFAERFETAPDNAISKFGYVVVPLLSDYYPQSIPTLHFYAEIYGSDQEFGADSLYLLSHQIESYEKRTIYGSFKRLTRARGKPVEPVLAQFDISNLPSGNYLVAIEVRDRTDKLIARREQLFQRNNPVRYAYDLQAMDQIDIRNTFAGAFANTDSLAEHIRSLHPLADALERKIIDDRWKDRELVLMQRFFYSFWANRDPDPEQAWKNYRQEVIKVNKLYSCRPLKGYETDRGRVYLKYGPPNTMMDRFHEMDAYPYTIWHYYRADKYTNRRFVFYQPDLARNCLELLHSEVPGELQNPRWNQVLHSRNVPMNNVDPRNVNNPSGERAIEFFNDPR